MVDAYKAVAGALIPSSEPPIVAAFEGNGQLRSIISKGKTGKIWLADLYRVTPLGIGPDLKPGSPLVSFYLNASDIASGLELGGAKPGEGIDDQYFLQISGLKVTYDMTKPLFGRVATVSLVDSAGVETVLEMEARLRKACWQNFLCSLPFLLLILVSLLFMRGFGIVDDQVNGLGERVASGDGGEDFRKLDG